MPTDREQEYIDAVAEHGSYRAAARALVVNESTIRNAIARAARRDPALHANGAPEGYILRGVSTYNEGTRQWVKTARDHDGMKEALEEVVRDIAESGRGVLEPIPYSVGSDEKSDDLMAVYPLADPHLRLLTWKPETGKNFDLKIAEQELKATFDAVVSKAPPARKAALISLGDFFHSDGQRNVTNSHSNALDVDGRFGKAAIAGVRILRHMIDRLLGRHEHVECLFIAGNHDENQSIWLSIVLSAVYENEPRVTIHVNPSCFQVIRFGANLIGACHGHTVPMKKLPGIMATDWREDWGETANHHWYVGHRHHDESNEEAGASWECIRTPAPADAWTHSMGFRAGRDLKVDIWHTKHGRISRYIQKVVEE
jgi:hypothetical protein